MYFLVFIYFRKRARSPRFSYFGKYGDDRRLEGEGWHTRRQLDCFGKQAEERTHHPGRRTRLFKRTGNFGKACRTWFKAKSIRQGDERKGVVEGAGQLVQCRLFRQRGRKEARRFVRGKKNGVFFLLWRLGSIVRAWMQNWWNASRWKRKCDEQSERRYVQICIDLRMEPFYIQCGGKANKTGV